MIGQILILLLFLLNVANASFLDDCYKNSDTIESNLKIQKIVKIEKISDYLKNNNKTADFDGEDRVFIVHFADASKGVFKTSETKNDIQSAIVAYKIAKKTGLVCTPPVITRKINGKIGSLQLFEENAKIIHNEYEIYKIDKESFEEMAIFYFLARQWDTGIHNFLFKTYKNTTYPISIDNESMFNQQQASYDEFFYMARCYCDNNNKEVKIDENNIEKITTLCKNCHFLKRYKSGDKFFIKNNRIFSDLQHGMRIYPTKCSSETIDKISKIDRKFLESIIDKKIKNCNIIINDILDRKVQVLNKCIIK